MPQVFRTHHSIFRKIGLILNKKARGEPPKQVDLRQGFYERNLVEVIHGRGAFEDSNTLAVTREGGVMERIQADGFVIATGARPYHPEDVDFDHPRIVDSDSILSIEDPKKEEPSKKEPSKEEELQSNSNPIHPIKNETYSREFIPWIFPFFRACFPKLDPGSSRSSLH